MTKDIPNGEGLSPERVLEIAKNHFDHTLDALDEILNSKGDGSDLDGAITAKASVDLRKASVILFEERKRVEQYRNKTSGVAYEYAVDLDKARDEVWRRLTCLRDKDRTGGVSE